MNAAITLENLGEATAQEVFDQVVEHAANQGCKAQHGHSGKCYYRMPGDWTIKCFAGALMSDEEYRWIEKAGLGRAAWIGLVAERRVPAAHEELITALQHMHDSKYVRVSDWSEEFRSFAAKRGLDPTNIPETIEERV